MKKLMIASAIAMTMAAGNAMASSGDVQFFGNVTEVTCDVTPEVGGAVTDMIQLGTVTKNGKGKRSTLRLRLRTLLVVSALLFLVKLQHLPGLVIWVKTELMLRVGLLMMPMSSSPL